MVVAGVVVFVLYDPGIQKFLSSRTTWCCAQPEVRVQRRPLLTTPLDGFTTRMKVAGWGGIIVALPVILWQIWRFIVPGLHGKEKKYAVPFILSSWRCSPSVRRRVLDAR